MLSSFLRLSLKQLNRALAQAAFYVTALLAMSIVHSGTVAAEIWPMPCGGSIEFQRINTPTESNWLMDMELSLGLAETEYPASNFVRSSFLAGSLSDGGEPDKRFFMLGTYEVTEPQFNTVMKQGDCAELDWSEPALPKVDASWFDAIEFTRRYTEWLAIEKPELLSNRFPGQSVFVRLPTETEWEFAARGGVDVETQEEFRAPLFPMPDGLESYAWYAGQESCDGRVRQVGQKKPNPAGLFDILGNVEEIVLEPFRLNSGGRLHGQAGGFVTRGGSCLTPQDQLSTAFRTEHDYYRGRPRLANKPPYSGFRIAVAAAAQPSYARTEDLLNDFARLKEYDGRDTTDEKVNVLVASDIPDKTKQSIKDVAADFDNEMVRRNRIEKRSIQSSLRSGALMVRSYRSDKQRLKRFEVPCEESKIDPSIDRSGRLCELAEQARNVLQMTRSIYSELVFQVAEDFSINELRSQKAISLASIKSSPRAEEFMEMYICHVERYQRQRDPDITAYFNEIVELDFKECSSSGKG